MTQAYNLSQLANKVNTSGQLDVSTGATGTLAQANGGTGTTTATNGQLLIGNGSGFTKATITAGTGITVTNGAGSIQIDNSSTGGQLQTEVFTSPGTWTKPSTATQVRVTVIGGGGGGALAPGNSGTTGGTSSFGTLATATGGSGEGYQFPTPGSGTPGSGSTTGTLIKSGNVGFFTTTGQPQSPSTVGSISGVNAVGSSIPSATPVASVGYYPYSLSSAFVAGASGSIKAGKGGYVIAQVSVSTPQPITIGANGSTPGTTNYSATGGVVIVEYVG